MPAESLGKTKDYIPVQAKKLLPFSFSLSKQTNKMILHKQIGLALLHCNISAYIQFAKYPRLEREMNHKVDLSPFLYNLVLNVLHLLPSVVKGTKEKMPRKRPTNIYIG